MDEGSKICTFWFWCIKWVFPDIEESEEQCTLIKKLFGEGKMCKEVQKMISNAVKRQPKPERCGRGFRTTIRMDRRKVRMAKISQ